VSDLHSRFGILEVGGVQVLDEVHGVLRHLGVKKLEGGNDVVHVVAAVVKDDLRDAELLDDPGQKRQIRLVANAHMNPRALELCTGRVDIDADDRGVWPEKALPHLERTALGNADLEHRHASVDPGSQVSLVRREVVTPLVDDLIVVAHEVLPQRSHSSSQS